MRSRLALLAALGLVALLPLSAAAQAVDLIGTWHVLIHYKDDNAGNPELERWDDKVWVFEKKGTRISWTEYPIAVFDDEKGRFERRHTGQYARILHYWEPDAAQLADIADGLQVNSRGAKSKTLRGSDAKGWSSSRQRSAASASVVTYQEVWTIEGMPTRPVFTRSDSMGGGRTDTVQGSTRYATTDVRDGGNVLSGTYERDGTRHGTFRMMRSGEAGALKSRKTQSEIQQEGFRRSLETNSELRKQTAAEIEKQLAESGVPLSDAELDELAGEAVSLIVQGVPREEIDQRIGEWIRERFAGYGKRGAVHDDAARYAWPFDASQPRQLLQGVVGEPSGTAKGRLFRGFRRREAFKYAFDFDLPVGTPVLAARAGVVARVVDGFDGGGPQQGMARKTNLVIVTHDDGSWAYYGHLKAGVPVEVGQRVEAGERLADSGDTGQLFEPELLFGVQRLDEDGARRSVDIRFDDGTSAGVVPVIGAYYGGK